MPPEGEMPMLLGWTVDMQPCVKHDGVGVGVTFYIQWAPDVIVPLWWCSVDRLPAPWVDVVKATSS